MKTFYHLLANALVATTKNSFVWFALTFWVYLETQSVISTSIVGGVYLVTVALSGFWLGSLVDHYRKKQILLLSSAMTLVLFSFGFALLHATPEQAFTSVTSPQLWLLVIALLSGSIAGNIYGIAIPTLVTVLVPEDTRDRANGMFGTVMGISFAITSVASGLVLGFGGMSIVLMSAIALTVLAMIHLAFIPIPEKKIIHTHTKEDIPASSPYQAMQEGEQTHHKVDIKGTIKIIQNIPGLFPLIFFTTFNNFLGGVFMALMDAYGLSLVSVQVWGGMWGFLSLGFIIGGLYISKKGLGEDPVRNLFRINIVTWTVCIFFTVQPSIILLTIGMLTWMCLVPFIEATEQTIIQKVVPLERQGRVFGFAQSIEQAASPLTAFLIGPIAQFIFIPFMTTGRGVDLIGDWFGAGVGRGIALVFITAGIIGLIVTLIAMRSPAYALLARKYRE